MTRRALCVGINDYPIPNMDLRGCVNDAKAWAALLTGHFDFAKSDVTVLLDKKATHASMLRGLEDLLRGARSGDVLVFTNSSHGTYLADRGGDASGDEPDRYDEAICPYDCKDNLLVDDDLRALFADIPRGVRFTVIADSCHSGSVTRVLPGLSPDHRMPRFLHPRELALPVISDFRRAVRKESTFPESSMRELLLSGCRSDQFSFDAKIGRSFRGAMSFHAIAAITEAGHDITYRRLLSDVRRRLAVDRFDQEPQLEGRVSYKRRKVFS